VIRLNQIAVRLHRLFPALVRDFRKTFEKENTMANMTPGVMDGGDEKVTTVIADDLEIRGTVKFRSSLMTKGIIEGEIISDGLLIVGPTAKVSATITTKNLISHGVIEGDVTASDRAILKKTAVHTGNITTPSIIIESGSLFNGACIMQRNPVEEVIQATIAVTESVPSEQEEPVETNASHTSQETESIEEIQEEQALVETVAAEEFSEEKEEFGEKKEEEEEKEETGSSWSHENEGRSRNPKLF
jgi:cytoskeletal protein CcmA (bactofilin family)